MIDFVQKWLELSILITIFHEFGHFIICFLLGHFQGIFIGFVKYKIPLFSVGIVSRKESILALIFPQILVPALLLLLYYPSLLELLCGTLSNALGGVFDILKVFLKDKDIKADLSGLLILIEEKRLVIKKI